MYRDNEKKKKRRKRTRSSKTTFDERKNPVPQLELLVELGQIVDDILSCVILSSMTDIMTS